MKRLIACAALAALAVTPVASAATTSAPAAAKAHAKAHAHAHGKIAAAPKKKKFTGAPADEYFGKLKMSILGIRNTIRDVGLRIDADSTHARNVMGGLPLAEDAIHDWEKKYPKDSWLPGTLFSLERLYAKVDSDEARSHAKVTMVWLVHDYPKSAFATTGKKELAQNLVGARPAPPAADPVAANP